MPLPKPSGLVPPTAMQSHPPADNGEIGWDSEISPGEEFKLFPEGVCSFEVLSMKRERKPMGSLGTCNVAELKLLCAAAADGYSQTIEEGLTLHSKLEWKLFQFFTSIGQRTHGDKTPLRPDWTKVPGAKGYALIKHREYTKRDGTKGKGHGVDKWLTYDEACALDSAQPPADGQPQFT